MPVLIEKGFTLASGRKVVRRWGIERPVPGRRGVVSIEWFENKDAALRAAGASPSTADPGAGEWWRLR
jgi:hypothetical protein